MNKPESEKANNGVIANSPAKRVYLDKGYEYIGELKNYLVNGYSARLTRKTTGPINDIE